MSVLHKGSYILRFARIVLTSDDLQSLHTTPKLIVPAKGLNKLITPLFVVQKLNFAYPAYIGHETILAFEADLETDAAGIDNGFFKGNSSRVAYQACSGSDGFVLTDSINQSLMLTTLTDDMTDGAGTGELLLYYATSNLD